MRSRARRVNVAGPGSGVQSWIPRLRLRYAIDTGPGITRVTRGRGFVYRLPDGLTVRSVATLNRIRRLAIPPAWTDVWIARQSNAHLQATGRDARGRKQYRYHTAWTAARDAAKYDRMLDFADVLPAIRKGVSRDLSEPPLSRPRVLATVVALLERTLIRVGNDEYARDNGSYGLTTMRNRHVRVRGSRVEFRFRGKAGVNHAIAIDDHALARDVRRCQDLPGQMLFAYRDDTHRIRRVGSTDVNRYLGSLAGRDVTAKDFRTWWGTVTAAVILRKAGPAPPLALGRASLSRRWTTWPSSWEIHEPCAAAVTCTLESWKRTTQPPGAARACRIENRSFGQRTRGGGSARTYRESRHRRVLETGDDRTAPPDAPRPPDSRRRLTI